MEFFKFTLVLSKHNGQQKRRQIHINLLRLDTAYYINFVTESDRICFFTEPPHCNHWLLIRAMLLCRVLLLKS